MVGPISRYATMSARTPFLSTRADEEEREHGLQLMLSNESYELVDEECYFWTPRRVVLFVIAAALFSLLLLTW